MRPAETGPETDSDSLLALALTTARSAGALLLEGWADVRSSVSTKSTQTDVVTAMDVASEKLIVSTLLEVRPADGVMGEEGAEVAGSSGVRWVIDPLDGTVNYLYGLPAWAVSIAAEQDGDVVAGVVHAPFLGLTYAASLTTPATRNGETIRTSTQTDPALALFATGFAYAAESRLAHAALLARIMGSIRDIRRAGSAALDLCSVADGSVDGYFESGPKHWDVAAGGFIAMRAGAQCSVIGDAVACANAALMSWLGTAGVHPPTG